MGDQEFGPHKASQERYATSAGVVSTRHPEQKRRRVPRWAVVVLVVLVLVGGFFGWAYFLLHDDLQGVSLEPPAEPLPKSEYWQQGYDYCLGADPDRVIKDQLEAFLLEGNDNLAEIAAMASGPEDAGWLMGRSHTELRLSQQEQVSAGCLTGFEEGL